MKGTCLIDLAFTQHRGKNPGQQDALWDGVQVFQQRDLPTTGRSVANEDRWVIAVADGVASSPMAQRASRVVLESLAAEISSGADFDVRTIRRVHGRLCDALAKGKTFGSSTTLAAIEYQHGQCKVLSIGDSRAYRISADGDWQQLSRDHTILNSMIDSGEADANMEYASFYSMLDSCLVADDEETDFPVHRSTTQLLPGDAILLCTDGVHDTLGNSRLKTLTLHPVEPVSQVESWRKAVLKAGSPDNFSMVLVRRQS